MTKSLRSDTRNRAPQELLDKADQLAEQVEKRTIDWRRDIHKHPELSNQEFRTSKLIAQHLSDLGMEVETGIAHTGVVGILKGGKEGPTVALRADMDALPITEETDYSFASKAKATYRGEEVGVMHACGHDAHTAILMGVAEILTAMQKDLQGMVKFIFQPAEEGVPEGEEGGAALMIKEGVLENPRPDAIFGLHVLHDSVGSLYYRSGPFMASMDRLHITVTGSQTHGGVPWLGVDPILVSSQIVTALQSIISRQLDITKGPAVISIGSIHGGNRESIIPDKVKLLGTIRAFDETMRHSIHQKIERIATCIAEAAGAKAEVWIEPQYPITVNQEELTNNMLPTLERIAPGKTQESGLITGSEDFSYYQQEVPGMFYFLGVGMKHPETGQIAPLHSPKFMVDESGLITGVRSLTHLTLDYMAMNR